MKIDPNDLGDDIKKYHEENGITSLMIDVFPGDANPLYETLVHHVNEIFRLDIEGKTSIIDDIDGDCPKINVEEYLKKLL